MVLQENYPSISFITGLWWILKCTSCNKLGYQQTVHIPSLFASTTRCSTEAQTWLRLSIPNQHVLWITRKSIIDSVQEKPAIPSRHRNHKGILNLCFQPLHIQHLKSRRNLQSWNSNRFQLFRLFFPSCSRKPALFGPIVSDFREAWQSVSTISRAKLRQHKPSPIHTKNYMDLKRIVVPSPSCKNYKGFGWDILWYPTWGHFSSFQANEKVTVLLGPYNPFRLHLWAKTLLMTVSDKAHTPNLELLSSFSNNHFIILLEASLSRI